MTNEELQRRFDAIADLGELHERRISLTQSDLYQVLRRVQKLEERPPAPAEAPRDAAESTLDERRVREVLQQAYGQYSRGSVPAMMVQRIWLELGLPGFPPCD